MATSKKKDVNRNMLVEDCQHSGGLTSEDNIENSRELRGHVQKSR